MPPPSLLSVARVSSRLSPSMQLGQTRWKNEAILTPFPIIRREYQTRPFSNRTRRLTQSQSQLQPNNIPPPPPPPPPKSILKETILSAPRWAKIIVITAFLILATVETTFWINVGMRYISFPSDPSSSAADVGNGSETLSAVIDDELRKHKLVGNAYERYKKGRDGKGGRGGD